MHFFPLFSNKKLENNDTAYFQTMCFNTFINFHINKINKNAEKKEEKKSDHSSFSKALKSLP